MADDDPQAYAQAMTDPREREEKQRREALESLKQLGERDTFATSALARTAQRATDHFAAKDAMRDARAADGVDCGKTLIEFRSQVGARKLAPVGNAVLNARRGFHPSFR